MLQVTMSAPWSGPTRRPMTLSPRSVSGIICLCLSPFLVTPSTASFQSSRVVTKLHPATKIPLSSFKPLGCRGSLPLGPSAQSLVSDDLPLPGETNDHLIASDEPSKARRKLLSSLVVAAATCGPERLLPAFAADGETSSAESPPEKRILLRGAVTLQQGTVDETGDGSALYVTARPDRPDNVPRAILDGTRGKPPPVLAGRFANPTFPFEFEMGTDDLTPEGAARTDRDVGADDGGGGSKRWWEGENLVVSARLDSDGVAATRDPTDLVGRGFYSVAGGGGDGSVTVELQGRGAAGKFFTGKGK